MTDVTDVIVALVRCHTMLRALDANPERYAAASAHLPAIADHIAAAERQLEAWVTGQDRRTEERRRGDRRRGTSADEACA